MQRGRTTLIVLTWITAAIGLLAAVVFATQAGDLLGVLLVLTLATIPVPVILWGYWWLDRVEPEPWRYKIAAFVWGGVVAVVIALALSWVAAYRLGLSESVQIAVVAPIVEELAKGLFLFLTLLRARRVIDGVLDGLILSGLAALGFAFVENIGYYAVAYFEVAEETPFHGASGATGVFFIRGVFSPFAHPLFTSAIGIAMGLAVSQRSRIAQWLTVATGTVISIVLHALWNGSLVIGQGVGFILVYLALAVLLLGLTCMAAVMRNKQFATLQKSLSYIAERGWLHPAEIPYLVWFNRRKQARKFATTHAGKSAGHATAEYQRLATELGFLHDAVMAGHSKPYGVERTYALLDEMHRIRTSILLPPALPPGVH